MRRDRPNARQRVPQPLLRSRLPSGRSAMEQPNATGDGDAALTPRFWLMVALTGVATGLVSDLLMLILFTVQRLAFDYHAGDAFEQAVEHTHPLHRMAPLLVAGVVGGAAWYLLRRFTPGKQSEVDEVLWSGEGRLSFRRSAGTSVISEVVIGLGASLGREAAPKLMGAVSGSLLSTWAHLSLAQRQLLVACGAGAGLAAVYNVPLGGALFTLEVMIGSITLPTVLPALACAGLATATAWLYLPNRPTYLDIPAYHLSGSLVVWSVVAGPLIGGLAAAYLRLIGWISHHRLRGVAALPAPLVAFAVLGVIGLRYPQLLGNGKGLAHDAFVGVGSLTLLAALAVLKPLVTALCLGSGASGGLFTPVLSTGAVLGAFGGLAWSQLWPGTPVGAYALVGAAAMIGAGMQAPLTALALVLELTHSGTRLLVPMVVATVLATAVVRWLDGYSIYTARLTAAPLQDDGARQ